MDTAHLQSFPVFKALTDAQLAKVKAIIREEHYEPGRVLIKEGDRGDTMFILLEGEVEVSKALTLFTSRDSFDTRDKSLMRISSQDHAIFGEMSLLNPDSERSATVKTLTPCRLGIIRRGDFTRLCELDSNLGYQVMKNMAEILSDRLRKANQDILKLTTAFSLALER